MPDRRGSIVGSPRVAADRAAHRLDVRHGTSYPAGSLLAANYDEFLCRHSELSRVFEPDEHTCLHSYAWTRDRLILVTLADVASRVEVVTPGSWERAPLSGIPAATDDA